MFWRIVEVQSTKQSGIMGSTHLLTQYHYDTTILQNKQTERTFIMPKETIASKRTFSTAQMTLAAIMTAITCVLGPLSIPIPISPVPITLTNLVIYFTVCFLGWKLGTVSYLLYLIIGLIGFPVFSAFGSGFGKLFGPTGGYLIGFIFMAVICGLTFEKSSKKPVLFAGLVLGSAVNYLFGTLWLAWQAHLTFPQALMAGVIPYLPGDLVKILLAVFLAPVIKKRLFSFQIHSSVL